MSRLIALLFVVAGTAAGPAARAAELLLFEQPGCVYCERWTRQIGPIYPKSAEGKRAPLRRIDMTQRRPADLAALKPVAYSPTFVLIDDDGREVGRILGYAGDEQFWSNLAVLMRRLERPQAGAPAALGSAPPNLGSAQDSCDTCGP